MGVQHETSRMMSGGRDNDFDAWRECVHNKVRGLVHSIEY